MRNERLAQMLQSSGMSTVRLAADVGVDPKTVERWVTLGRLPRPAHRSQIAEVLRCPVAHLWPSIETVGGRASVGDDLIAMYRQRREVPTAVWRSLLHSAKNRVDIMAYAATFFADQVSDLGREFRELGEAGVMVRLLFGDPASAAVSARAAEEGVSGLAGRIDLVLRYVSAALGQPNVEVRLHDTVLYASMFRFDEEILVNPHALGSPAGDNPVLHMRDRSDGVAGAWLQSFDRVWSSATPITSWPR